MTEVVHDARQYLAVVGSRSRDAVYLQAIETVLAERPELVHYWVLFGPPRHQVLKDHLLRLITIRDPHDRSLGVKTLHIRGSSGRRRRRPRRRQPTLAVHGPVVECGSGAEFTVQNLEQFVVGGRPVVADRFHRSGIAMSVVPLVQ
jgi:hypothetical protein